MALASCTSIGRKAKRDIVQRFDPDPAETRKNDWPEGRITATADDEFESGRRLLLQEGWPPSKPLLKIREGARHRAAVAKTNAHGALVALMRHARAFSFQDRRKTHLFGLGGRVIGVGDHRERRDRKAGLG